MGDASGKSAPWTDPQLAHFGLRMVLGINIAIHGLIRLPHLQSFASGVLKDFEPTILPAWMVAPFAYAIPFVEALVGLMVLLGLRLRFALCVGGLFIAALTLGTALRQEWQVAGLQLIYALAYFLLQARAADARLTLDRVLFARTDPSAR